MICIYKITSPTDGIYIGQSRNYENRYKSGVSPKQTRLYRSIQKYGFDAHQFEVIEEFAENISKERLDGEEVFWIAFYKNNGFKVLNLRSGGSRGLHSDETITKMKLVQKARYDRDPSYFKEAHRRSVISNTGRKRREDERQKISKGMTGRKLSNNHRSNLSKAKKGKPNGLTGSKYTNERLINSKINHCKPIIQLDLDGNFIKKWLGATPASEGMGLSKSAIFQCLRGVNKTAGNFRWLRASEYHALVAAGTEIPKLEKNASRLRPIIQLDLEENLVKEWPGITVASTDTGIRRERIENCLSGHTKSCDGFRWQKAEDYYAGIKLKPLRYTDSRLIPVVQLDTDGNFIKVWPGGSVASVNLNLHKSAVLNCICGNSKSAGGFRWVKASEYNKEAVSS
jgi:group I intron endonuclease